MAWWVRPAEHGTAWRVRPAEHGTAWWVRPAEHSTAWRVRPAEVHTRMTEYEISDDDEIVTCRPGLQYLPFPLWLKVCSSWSGKPLIVIIIMFVI